MSASIDEVPQLLTGLKGCVTIIDDCATRRRIMPRNFSTCTGGQLAERPEYRPERINSPATLQTVTTHDESR